MKLNYSTSTLVSFIFTHIIFILILHFPSHIQTADNEDEPISYEISQENKKIIVDQVKANLLKVLGLKEAPKKPHNIAVVPQAMLEEYRSLRDSVRVTIPDDRDFYGKINIHDIEKRHADFWSAVHNIYGAYDIEVDMGDDATGSTGFLYRGDAKIIAQVKLQNEPEDVPKKYEHLLPPHPINSQDQKQFISVHMRFNLSQELLTNPISAVDLRAAELHLSRERILDCEFSKCDKIPVPFFNKDNTSLNNQDSTEKQVVRQGTNAGDVVTDADRTLSSNERQNNKNREKFVLSARYQRVYLLLVVGYDSHDEPITRIHDSQRIDTQQSSPLRFDVTQIIKRWLVDPTKNYGIIIRVTNEDLEEEKMKRRISSNLNLDSVSKTNASPQDLNSQQKVVEDHVRLRRGFQSTSESNETWLLKQPFIYIFSGHSLEAARYHVKREHPTDDPENMQADQPSEVTSEATSYNPVQSEHLADDSHNIESSQPIPSNSLSPSPSNSKNPAGPNNNQQTTIGRRDSRQANRNVGNSNRAATISNRSRGKGKPTRTAEKCSMRTLQINFDEVGWSSWIIAPTSFFANYCSGDCSYPMSDSQNATNHAIIQSIFNSVGRVVPRACCAPNKLANMAILYQLDGVVQMRHYDDMIVQSCGCQ